jgi:hypothetical protein
LLRDTAAVNPDHTPAPAPQRRRGLIAGIAAGALVLIAVTVGVTLAVTHQPKAGPLAADQRTQPAATPTSSAPTVPAATTTSASPTVPAGPTVLKFGVKAEGPGSTTVAYAYKQPVATSAPKPDVEGFEWAAADIEVCVNEAATISRARWHLTYADHTVIDASNVGYRGFPAPEFPWEERDLAAGGCVRGWLTFAVPHGKKPLTVQYLPRDYAADLAGHLTGRGGTR